MTVVFDISRMLSRARFDTPTGIDRFEFNYANWAATRFGNDLQFVASGPLGHRSVSSGSVRSLIAATGEKWSASRDRDQNELLKWLACEIDGTASAPRLLPAPPSSSAGKAIDALRAMSALMWSPSQIPSSSLFIHVSHAQIHKPSRYDWLARRMSRPLFYVHDLIPLLRPEFCRTGEAVRHRARIQTILRYHRLILCNSQSTARTLDELAASAGLAQPFTAVLPPGLEDTFLQFDPRSRLRTTRPYFVCLGTIEPRKNHALLLEIWRHLIERYGARAPRLVILGRRGWDNEHVFSLLDEKEIFRGAVIELPSLSDRAVAQVLGGASALLAPSHIEGYGMPVAEALAIGTPVIASNIRAHREASRGRAVLLDALDGLGWMGAIEAHARWPRRNDPSEQKHWTWSAHFKALHRLLVSAKLEPAQQALRPIESNFPAADRLAGAQSCQAI